MKYIKGNYERFYGKTPDASSYGKVAKLVERVPEILKTGRILDLGAGDGRNALFLASAGFNVKAIDISEAGLAKLKRLADERGLRITTEHADLNTWSIDGDYDAILSVLVFQHLRREESLRLVNEMKARTKLGGVNVVVAFTTTGDRARMDREEDPEAFYETDGWFKDFYSDWEILGYDTVDSPLVGKTRDDGKPMMNMLERILARKLV